MSLRFNNSETKGAIILSIIISFFLLTKHFYFDFYSKNNQINFDDKNLQEQYQTFIKEHKFDLNDLKEEDLLNLGIYKNLSTNLIKYREQLGGFISFDQIREIKNINEQTIKTLEEFTLIDKNFIPKKLKVNYDEFKVLLRHPYLDFEDVKNICNYRKFEKIKTVETLSKEKLLSSEKIKKIKPYLDFA